MGTKRSVSNLEQAVQSEESKNFWSVNFYRFIDSESLSRQSTYKKAKQCKKAAVFIFSAIYLIV